MAADILTEVVEFDIATDGATQALSNDVGATSKAFFRMLSAGSRASGSGPTGSTANTSPAAGACAVQLTGTATLTGHITTGTQKAVGEVWRYTGTSGGANEFIVRAHGSVTIPSGAASASAAVSGIVSDDDCVPIITGIICSHTSKATWDRATCAIHLDGSSNLVASRNNSDASAVTVYFAVVEFTGSAWTVAHGVSPAHDTATETVTLNTSATGTGGSTVDVSDWATATILAASMEGDTAESGLADTLALVWPAAGTTQVNFSTISSDANARNDGDAYLHVIKHADLSVTRALITSWAEASGVWASLAWPSGAPTTVPIDELGWEWFVSTNGTGTAHCRGAVGPKRTSGSAAQGWVHRTGNNIRVRYGVVDLSGIASAGAATWTGSTGTVEAVATSGSFTPGAAVWTGSTATVEVVASTGAALQPSLAAYSAPFAVYPGSYVHHRSIDISNMGTWSDGDLLVLHISYEREHTDNTPSNPPIIRDSSSATPTQSASTKTAGETLQTTIEALTDVTSQFTLIANVRNVGGVVVAGTVANMWGEAGDGTGGTFDKTMTELTVCWEYSDANESNWPLQDSFPTVCAFRVPGPNLTVEAVSTATGIESTVATSPAVNVPDKSLCLLTATNLALSFVTASDDFVGYNRETVDSVNDPYEFLWSREVTTGAAIGGDTIALDTSQGTGDRLFSLIALTVVTKTDGAGSGGFVAGTATWTGSTATVEAVAVSGAFVGSGGGPQIWTGTTATIEAVAVSGSFAPGATTWTGTTGTVELVASPGVFSAGAVTWTGSTGAIEAVVVSGSFASGAATWTGSTATIEAVGTSGAFTSGAAVWAGSTATVEAVAVSGSFASGAATWTGSTATIETVALSGSFTPGATTWAGSTATVEAVGTSGAFTAGSAPQTWTGSTATVEAAAISGSFVSDQTWTGSTATIEAAAVSGSFTAGATTWTGSAVTVELVASSGTFTPAATTWTGSTGTVEAAAISGAFTAGIATWTGTTGTVELIATSGSFTAVLPPDVTIPGPTLDHTEPAPVGWDETRSTTWTEPQPAEHAEPDMIGWDEPDHITLGL